MAELQTIVLTHLPYLRRYARALTGSQAAGDQCIRRTVEAVLRQPQAITQADKPRRELYRAFHAALRPGELAAGGGADDPLVQRLTELAPLHRQLLLLTTVEEFSHRDAAYILGIEEAAVPAALERARTEMRRQAPTSVLIVEDEPVIALSLSDIVGGAGHSVVGVAMTKREAVALATQRKPGLMLVDIQLRDGSSGVEAVQEILHDASVPVVFITAFPERLLTGDRPEPTFLVTKPFNPATVLTTISQALLSVRASH